ncbi:hypothetical protein [Rhizobium sp. MHM7A]|uniref:hypothetical protein n=1 Tax=Rhizobium sp. MHM7A TaxID=2583233 RepID=UPI001105C8AD|nr:hypothetical protein [Rhizobium sp. MHM7A]TLX16529.1 hypothetical protein FFR93_04105 [Rhizobium sp. MHM7A]
METLWPRYGMYSAEEIKRGLGRSQFVFLSLAALMTVALVFALFKGSVPLIVASTLGVIQNLFALVFVSKKHLRTAAALLVITNVLVAALHVIFLQPDSAISIALSIYSINMLRACIALKKISL